jgi:hypothetical protein
MLKRGVPLLALLSLILIPLTAQAGTQVWRIDEGTVTFALNDGRLEDLGLGLVNPRTTADVSADRAFELSFELPIYSFRVPAGTGLEFVTENGTFSHFVDGAVSIPVDGGFAFEAWNPRSRAALEPAFLYDFSVDVDPAQERLVLPIRTLDPALPFPLEVVNSALHVDWNAGVLSVRMADALITEAWAERLGRPELAGRPLGAFDMRLSITKIRGAEILDPQPNYGSVGGGTFQDVKLGELYGLASNDHIGTFPNGRSGLSAATTSCNVGDVDVPWNGPMAETHPFIGLVLFREYNGSLEMIGQNYMKHGFFALSNSQCTPCQNPSGGSFLGVGCSDTYGFFNNASAFYLGPRDEVDPYSGTWEACGSLFDGVPVDCQRDYSSEPNGVNHRLEVEDVDLNVTGATLYYEGIYVIADEDNFENEIGWREVSSYGWDGSEWDFTTAPGPGGSSLHPFEGSLVLTWGDAQWAGDVAPNDGAVHHAVKVTDNGDGTWHYDYLVYNRNSSQAVDELVVPVGSANITNLDFHDVDHDAGNDWTATVSSGTVTWSTTSHPIEYQTMFNFRFDADAPPVNGTIIGGIWRPASNTSFNMDSRVPDAATGVLAGRELDELRLESTPNPFAESTKLTFAVSRSQPVQLKVLDVTGRTIRTLVDGPVPAGPNSVRWDGRDSGGAQAASGVYFFRLVTDEGLKTIKSTYLR